MGLSIWDELRPLEEALNKKFEKMMKKNEGESMLEDIMEKMQTEVVPAINNYTKSSSTVETSSMTVGEYTLNFRIINYIKEKDGIRIPHIIKQVFCNPAVSVECLRDNCIFKETINDEERRVLTQFLDDANIFGDQSSAFKIHRFKNEIDVDANSGRNQYIIKVWFDSVKRTKLLYTFTYLQGTDSATYRIDYAPTSDLFKEEEPKII